MSKNFNAWPEQWPKTIDFPELPVYTLLDQTVERVPNRLAIIFGGMELTFSELKDLSLRFATALSAQGIKKGDRVAIHLPNSPQFAIAYYGILRIGAVFTPLSPLLTPREAKYQLNDSGTKLLITLDLLYLGIAGIIPETKVETVISTSIADCYNPIIQPLKLLEKIEVPDTLDMAALLQEHPPEPPEVTIDPKKDLVHIAYTGGTTGLSKGVALTHFNVTTNVFQFSSWFDGGTPKLENGKLFSVYPDGVDPKRDRSIHKDSEISIVVAPWFHAMGTIGYLNCPVYSGNTSVVLPRFDPVEYVETLVKYKVTLVGGAPQLYIPLLALSNFDTYDFSTVKMVASGAAPLSGTILGKLKEAFSGLIVEAYGMTECSMGAMSNPPDREKTRLGSVGLPIFNTEAKIVDIETGEELPSGEEGEICIKGPQVMQGYWNKPEETAKVMKDGWLLSGDIGKIDEDGYFFITDRKKDMIIYKGYNVYPRELEELLFENPAVEQCAVIGKPDDTAGEIPVAFVQLAEGKEVTVEALMESVNSQVAPYKKLRKLTFIEAVPVSEAGKVLKRELREDKA